MMQNLVRNNTRQTHSFHARAPKSGSVLFRQLSKSNVGPLLMSTLFLWASVHDVLLLTGDSNVIMVGNNHDEACAWSFRIYKSCKQMHASANHALTYDPRPYI
jgi:hypothetical protein